MNNREIIKKLSEIRVEGNWREVVEQRRSGWKLYGKDTRIYGVDRNKVEVGKMRKGKKGEADSICVG